MSSTSIWTRVHASLSVSSTSTLVVLYLFLSVVALALAVAELVLGNTAQTFGCVAISLAFLTLSRLELVLHEIRQANREQDPS